MHQAMEELPSRCLRWLRLLRRKFQTSTSFTTSFCPLLLPPFSFLLTMLILHQFLASYSSLQCFFWKAFKIHSSTLHVGGLIHIQGEESLHCERERERERERQKDRKAESGMVDIHKKNSYKAVIAFLLLKNRIKQGRIHGKSSCVLLGRSRNAN